MTNANDNMLTTAMLERLGAAWRNEAAPIADNLAPGIEVASFEDGDLRVQLPDELRLLWRWHDGAAASAAPVERTLGPLLTFWSSSEAETGWRRYRALSLKAAEGAPGRLGDPEYWWKPSWIPLTSDGSGFIVADCELGYPALAPIRRIEWGPDLDVLSRPRTTSLGQLITWWTEALETGIWRYDSTARVWRSHPRDDTEERYAGLV